MYGRIQLEKKEVLGKTYYYKDIGSGLHGRKNFRLWINKKIVDQYAEKDEDGKLYLQFPIKNAAIEVTQKGTHVLRPHEGTNIFHYYIECGYRGYSKISIIEPENAKIYRYDIYHSPRGNLGESEGAFICAPAEKIILKWNRTGRTYGGPHEGYAIVYLDGRVEEVEDLGELEELEELII